MALVQCLKIVLVASLTTIDEQVASVLVGMVVPTVVIARVLVVLTGIARLIATAGTIFEQRAMETSPPRCMLFPTVVGSILTLAGRLSLVGDDARIVTETWIVLVHKSIDESERSRSSHSLGKVDCIGMCR